MLIVIILAAVIVFLVTIVMYYEANINRKKLWTDYQNALQSGDKRKALDAGRKFYSTLRNGRLSIYDEQAISNDLAVMKENKI